MTDTSANPVTTPRITWQDIKPKLPLIQNDETSEPRMQPFFRTFGVEFDQVTSEWVVTNSTFGFIGEIQDIHSADIHDVETELQNFLFRYYSGLLQSVVNESVYDILLTVAKQIPYIQTCTCSNYPTGQADDCHEHNDEPMHFFGDFSFACTCDEQNTTR